MPSEVMCPICGEPIPDDEMDYLDNGSPAHHACVIKEDERAQKEPK